MSSTSKFLFQDISLLIFLFWTVKWSFCEDPQTVVRELILIFLQYCIHCSHSCSVDLPKIWGSPLSPWDLTACIFSSLFLPDSRTWRDAKKLLELCRKLFKKHYKTLGPDGGRWITKKKIKNKKNVFYYEHFL